MVEFLLFGNQGYFSLRLLKVGCSNFNKRGYFVFRLVGFRPFFRKISLVYLVLMFHSRVNKGRRDLY